MLRLNVCCRLVPELRRAKTVSNSDSWVLRLRSVRNPFPQRIQVKALRDETNGGGGASGFTGRNWNPEMEIEVPFEQRPGSPQWDQSDDRSQSHLMHHILTLLTFRRINLEGFVMLSSSEVNEYSSLKDGPLYSWGELSPGPFFVRLGGLWLTTFIILGVPIAAASFNPARDPLRFALAAGTGTLFLVSLVVLRIYLGWSYVGDRLLSAVIPYEETGWYDGQMWVKPPEVLARDRLLGAYKVKPVIKLLKQTLVGTGAALVTATLLFIFATPVQDFLQTTFTTNENQSNVSSSKISANSNIRREDLVRLPGEVMRDDDLAAAAAEAADGRPVYCRDRFYRALAGGQYCKWEDLLN